MNAPAGARAGARDPDDLRRHAGPGGRRARHRGRLAQRAARAAHVHGHDRHVRGRDRARAVVGRPHRACSRTSAAPRSTARATSRSPSSTSRAALVWGYGVRTFGMGRNPATYFALNVLVGLVVAIVGGPDRAVRVRRRDRPRVGRHHRRLPRRRRGDLRAPCSRRTSSSRSPTRSSRASSGLAIIRALPPRYTRGPAAAGGGRDADAARGDAGHGRRRGDPARLPPGPRARAPAA